MLHDERVDEIDVKILELLQGNARIANAEMARQVGLAPSAVLERVRRLEERGIILGYETRLRPKDLGLGLLAFVFVRTDSLDPDAVAKALGVFPEVQEIHDVAGEDCLLIKVRVADPEALSRLLRERVTRVSGVRSTRTTIVLQTEKETSRLPVQKREGKRNV